MTTAIGPWHNDPKWVAYDDDRRGTSTSDAESALRDIGTHVFGITYPKDVTPKRLLPSHDDDLDDSMAANPE